MRWAHHVVQFVALPSLILGILWMQILTNRSHERLRISTEAEAQARAHLAWTCGRAFGVGLVLHDDEQRVCDRLHATGQFP